MQLEVDIFNTRDFTGGYSLYKPGCIRSFVPCEGQWSCWSALTAAALRRRRQPIICPQSERTTAAQWWSYCVHDLCHRYNIRAADLMAAQSNSVSVNGMFCKLANSSLVPCLCILLTLLLNVFKMFTVNQILPLKLKEKTVFQSFSTEKSQMAFTSVTFA